MSNKDNKINWHDWHRAPTWAKFIGINKQGPVYFRNRVDAESHGFQFIYERPGNANATPQPMPFNSEDMKRDFEESANFEPVPPPKIRKGTNEYGVDVDYFSRCIQRDLTDLSRYKPDELARVFARLSITADKAVINEPEFKKNSLNQFLTLSKNHNQELFNKICITLSDMSDNALANGFDQVNDFEQIKEAISDVLDIKPGDPK